MIVLRLVTLGLLGCILGVVLSLAGHAPGHVRHVAVHRAPRAVPLRIVDVAAGADPATLLVGDYRDRITAIDDAPVASTAAGIDQLRAHPPAHGQYVDVTLANARTNRETRVLLLMH